MLRSVPMVRLRIQVPAADASRVARRIAAEGLLHLVDIAHGRFAHDASPPGARELLASFRDLARRTRRAAERLGVTLPEPIGDLRTEDAARDPAKERDWIEARLSPIEKTADEIAARSSTAKERRRRAEESAANAARAERGGLDLTRLLPLRFSLVRLGLAKPEDLAALATLLAPAPFAILPLAAEGPRALAAVAVPASSEAMLTNALRSVSFEAFALPASAADWDATRLADERRAAEEDVARVAADAARAAKDVRAELVDLARRAELGVLLLQAETCFAASGRFVVISGWVPADAAERMRLAIGQVTEGRAVVDVDRPEELPEVASGALRVPILHRNPILLRPFERLVRLYGTPEYGEVEPTAFFAVSFLLMFGLMFGDVGHGAVLFSAGFSLFRFFPRFLDYGILLMEAGAASTVFGFLYGSLFGIERLLPVLWIEPLHDLPRLMTVAVVLGVVLVSLGLLLNARNAWKAEDRVGALFGPRGLLGAFLYWLLLALAARAFLPAGASLPAGVLFGLLGAALLALVLKTPLLKLLKQPPRERHTEGPRALAALEGSVELVDTLVSYVANTVSFLRVAAFGMVHAGAFLALFALADTLRGMRLGGALSILVLVAGNAVVILLEGLTVSVQVLRLEYYEFFGKFFRGGGEPYRPLTWSAGKGNP